MKRGFKMNNELLERLVENMKGQIKNEIGLSIQKHIFDYIDFDNDIDYHELEESILLSILKLR